MGAHENSVKRERKQQEQLARQRVASACAKLSLNALAQLR
jgi:hypothetical protein